MKRHQHPSNNHVLGAPPGMSAEECNALPVTVVQFEDGTPAVVSYWMPSAEERDLIMQLKPVRLTVLGTTHAPLLLGVDGDGAL